MRPNRGSRAVPFLALGLLFLSSEITAASAPPPDTGRILADLERSRLPLPQIHLVEALDLAIGPARLTLAAGEMHWTPAAGGRGAELVLFGEGRIVLPPLDAVEGEQMRLFTGSATLDTAFSRAALTIADRNLLDPWLHRRASPAGSESLRRAEARGLLERWKGSAERERLQVDAALLRAAHDPAQKAPAVAAWLLDSDLGDILLRLDPSQEAAFWVGQLVRPDPERVSTRRLRRLLHDQQRRGRWFRLSPEDLGLLDTWTAVRLSGPNEPRRPALDAIDHYRLDLEVEPGKGTLRGTAWIGARRETLHPAIVSLLLHPDLEVLAARDAAGRPLSFLRRGDQVHLVLGELGAGRPEEFLEIDYAGPILEEMPDRGFTLRDTVSWHPRGVGSRRATWDVTLRWPADLDLVASGHLETSGRSLRRRWERRRLEAPSSGFGFELGSFTERTRTVGDLTVDFAFDSGLVRLSGGHFEALEETVVAVLEAFTDLFGPLTIDHLQVVTVPRPVSQTQGGLITFSDPMIADWGALGTALGLDDRRQVIAHEIAHLWWGEQIPWAGESDRWLGEALADFLAATWAEQASARPPGSRPRLEAPPAGPPDLLWRPMANGRPLVEAGPPVLGERLDSSLTLGLGAQEAILYGKGRKILQSLALRVGRAELLGFLGRLARSSGGRPFSTSAFLDGLAEHSGQNLEAFSRRFVFGSGLETVLYEWGYRRRNDGRFDLWIETRSEPPRRYGFELRRDETLLRRALEPPPSDPVKLRIPLQILLAEGGSENAPRERRLLTGTIDHDTSTGGRLEVSIDERPEQVWLDLVGTTLARCFDLGAVPALGLLHRGRQLVDAGQWQDALSTLTAALDAAPGARTPPAPPHGASSGPGLESLRENLLHEIFRAQLEVGALEEAERILEQLRREIAPQNAAAEARVTLGQARLALRHGRPEEAYAALTRARPERTLRKDPEPLLVLALAARATGREEEAVRALRRARHLGVVIESSP